MRLFISILICLLFYKPVSAQKDAKVINGSGLVFGQFLAQKPGGFGFSSLGKPDFFTPLQFIGFGFVGTFTLVNSRKFSTGGSLDFAWIIKQPARFHDTIAVKSSGFMFHFPLLGYDLFGKSPTIDLLLELGFNTGRVKVKGDANLHTNPFLCPSLAISPKVKIADLALGVKGEYCFDVSNPAWRTKVGAASYTPFGWTGFNLMLSLSLGLD
jgi:hypothetical protein